MYLSNPIATINPRECTQKLNEQFNAFERLKKLQENFKQNICKNEGERSARKEMVSKYYKLFSERDTSIQKNFAQYKLNTANHEYFKQDLAFQCELLYLEMIGELSEDRSQSTEKLDEPSTSTPQVQRVARTADESKVVKQNGEKAKEKIGTHGLSEYLSKLNVARFSGDPMDWLEFEDQFYEKILYKSDLNISEKFYALKSLLPVEVFKLVKHFYDSGTKSDLRSALKLLDEKYRTNDVVNNCLERLLKQHSVNQRSTKSIFEFLENTLKYLTYLRYLKVDMSNWDVLLVSVLEQKLDKITKSKWNQANSGDKLPTLIGFLTFLNKKQEEKDFSNEIDKFNNVGDKKTSSWECVCCNGVHPLWGCDRFELMNIDERLTLVQKKEICMICLSNAHNKLATCPKGFTCRICQSKNHHYLLHKNAKRN